MNMYNRCKIQTTDKNNLSMKYSKKLLVEKLYMLLKTYLTKKRGNTSAQQRAASLLRVSLYNIYHYGIGMARDGSQMVSFCLQKFSFREQDVITL